MKRKNKNTWSQYSTLFAHVQRARLLAIRHMLQEEQRAARPEPAVEVGGALMHVVYRAQHQRRHNRVVRCRRQAGG